ncbi:MAG: AAA domain-containing protein [Actinobacteria bacterium]|nr:AAA domain-containing protein [Actinomycetota bacterium]
MTKRRGSAAWSSVDDLQRSLRDHRYLADRGLATALHLAVSLERPLFLEGEAGVGKTETANVLASILGSELIRLQCYEGIGVAQAIYDWNYPRQFLAVRASEGTEHHVSVDDLFSWEFLVERPLLRAIRTESRSVLLIDEVDRADDEFEAFLLEVLSDFSITIPEVGTITAQVPPVVILTSNRTREVHDALKRRCFYHVIPHPDLEMESQIIRLRVPEATASLAHDVARAVAGLRKLPLTKSPGVAETIDWTRALSFLGVTDLRTETARDTIGAAIKQEEDLGVALEALPRIIGADG